MNAVFKAFSMTQQCNQSMSADHKADFLAITNFACDTITCRLTIAQYHQYHKVKGGSGSKVLVNPFYITSLAPQPLGFRFNILLGQTCSTACEVR